jgi:hypothetical protein
LPLLHLRPRRVVMNATAERRMQPHLSSAVSSRGTQTGVVAQM